MFALGRESFVRSGCPGVRLPLGSMAGATYIGSQVTKMGSFTTDASGVFSTNITIPSQVAAGAHELYAVAEAPNGVNVLASKINVNRAGPAAAACVHRSAHSAAASRLGWTTTYAGC